MSEVIGNERKSEVLEAQIEAILFAVGEAVEAGRLAAALLVEEEELRFACSRLSKRYEAAGCGLRLIELDGAFQIGTKPAMYESILKLVHVPKKHVLTDVLLETLSIIAYKQPITKQEIEAIRGVKTDHAVNKLVEYNLICEVGRLDAPGRPIVFGTTEEFLRCFGLSSLEELPIVDTELTNDFKQQAEEEVLRIKPDL